MAQSHTLFRFALVSLFVWQAIAPSASCVTQASLAIVPKSKPHATNISLGCSDPPRVRTSAFLYTNSPCACLLGHVLLPSFPAVIRTDEIMAVMHSPRSTLIAAFCAWKCLLLLVAAACPGPGYDSSSTLLLGNDSAPSALLAVLQHLLLRLIRWDAVYFATSATRGHVFEQEWAFSWPYARFTAGVARGTCACRVRKS